MFRYNDKIYPHLDLVFLCDYYGVNVPDINVEFGSHIEFKHTKNFKGIKRIPIDEKGNFLINFRQGEKFLETRAVAMHHILHYKAFGEKYGTVIEPDKFKDSIVILGENTVGGTDTQPIPLQAGFPMVGIHANVLDNILRGDYLRLMSPGAISLLIIVCGLLLGITFVFVEYRKATAISVFLIVSSGGLCSVIHLYTR